ncbi:hypothetical protein MRB53_023600 [Persea americana]|uniref:Uncharacterized protein n=1 Tax=Persea americana TaxID=3435 RepID=A0ACC2LA94_PERAE|nr:hypothetical protein MRB53_023600 [Persea americana]
MPCLAASGAGTADVASARDTVVAAMSEVAAEPYTEEPEHVAAVAEEAIDGKINEISTGHASTSPSAGHAFLITPAGTGMN